VEAATSPTLGPEEVGVGSSGKGSDALERRPELAAALAERERQITKAALAAAKARGQPRPARRDLPLRANGATLQIGRRPNLMRSPSQVPNRPAFIRPGLEEGS
jgi:hypothetical protein